MIQTKIADKLWFHIFFMPQKKKMKISISIVSDGKMEISFFFLCQKYQAIRHEYFFSSCKSLMLMSIVQERAIGDPDSPMTTECLCTRSVPDNKTHVFAKLASHQLCFSLYTRLARVQYSQSKPTHMPRVYY